MNISDDDFILIINKKTMEPFCFSGKPVYWNSKFGYVVFLVEELLHIVPDERYELELYTTLVSNLGESIAETNDIQKTLTLIQISYRCQEYQPIIKEVRNVKVLQEQ